MPPGQQSLELKLKKSVKALKSLGWRSINEFVEQTYNNEDMAAQSLRFREDSSYAPEAILTAWLARVPSEAARAELNMAITRKAATIMVDESTKAYHHADLRLSTSDLELAYDTPDFGLQKLQDLYLSLLPCLSYLLHALLTAQNDYERWNKREKIGKDDMALKVSTCLFLLDLVLTNLQVLVMIISVLLFFRNRATNAFQIIMGIFLASSGASRRIIDTLNHMGLSVSYQWVPWCEYKLFSCLYARIRQNCPILAMYTYSTGQETSTLICTAPEPPLGSGVRQHQLYSPHHISAH